MSAHKLLRGSLAAVLALFGAAACTGDMDELQQYVAQVKARKSTQIEPIPQIKQYEAFTYVAGNRRDPFEPAPETNDNGLRPDTNRNREPLEEFPLDSLRMVGVIDYNKVLYALIKAPDNVIHRVTVGNYMGQNFGKIVKITETEVALDEIVPDGFGGFKEQPATLAAEQK
jgi:type IV pilus assembly protein PilP